MANEPNVEPSLTDVVSGIVVDFQKLVAQQLALLRAEVRTDWDKSKRALKPIVIGAVFAAIGALLLGFAAAFGLHWAVSPAGVDAGRLPLWACFALTAAGFVVVGLALIAVGTKAFQSFNPLPVETAAALEQNLKALVDGRPSALRS